jgi:methyl-accepting chemotaxis protein
VGHAVFEWVVAAGVIVVFVSNIVLLWRINKTLHLLTAQSQALTERLTPIISDARSVLGDLRDVVAALAVEARPVVRAIATTTSEVTDLVHVQALELRALIRDTVLTVRHQIERLDDLVTRTTERVDQTTEIIQKQVLEPVRELHYLVHATRRALSYLFTRRKPVDRVYQEEELFI